MIFPFNQKILHGNERGIVSLTMFRWQSLVPKNHSIVGIKILVMPCCNSRKGVLQMFVKRVIVYVS